MLGCRSRMPNLITHSGYQWLGACETAEKVVFSSDYRADEGCTEHGVSGASPGLAMGPAAGAEVGLLCTCVIWKRNTCRSRACSYFMRCCLASGAPAVSLQGRFCRFCLGLWEALGMVYICSCGVPWCSAPHYSTTVHTKNVLFHTDFVLGQLMG